MRSQIYSSTDLNVTLKEKNSLLSVHSRFINTAIKSAVNNKYALNKSVNFIYCIYLTLNGETKNNEPSYFIATTFTGVPDELKPVHVANWKEVTECRIYQNQKYPKVTL